MAGDGAGVRLPEAPPRITVGRILVLAVVALVYFEAIRGTEITRKNILNIHLGS